jgi:hypothetical protein
MLLMGNHWRPESCQKAQESDPSILWHALKSSLGKAELRLFRIVSRNCRDSHRVVDKVIRLPEGL